MLLLSSCCWVFGVLVDAAVVVALAGVGVLVEAAVVVALAGVGVLVDVDVDVTLYVIKRRGPPVEASEERKSI
ncbi:MAG TPA: hypothetical protein VK390_15385 [Propionibacteriaceae bacterium]|nr:hypothetical protein [Propionibacteriaceae bacterium]